MTPALAFPDPDPDSVRSSLYMFGLLDTGAGGA